MLKIHLVLPSSALRRLLYEMRRFTVSLWMLQAADQHIMMWVESCGGVVSQHWHLKLFFAQFIQSVILMELLLAVRVQVIIA